MCFFLIRVKNLNLFRNIFLIISLNINCTRVNIDLIHNTVFREKNCYITSSLYSKENKGEERRCRKVFKI